jgi:hypothetical protein
MEEFAWSDGEEVFLEEESHSTVTADVTDDGEKVCLDDWDVITLSRCNLLL